MELTQQQKDTALVAAVQYALNGGHKIRMNIESGTIHDIALLIQHFGGVVDVNGDDDQCWIDYILTNKKTESVVVINSFATSLAWANQIGAFSARTMVFCEPTKVAVLDDSYIVIE